MRVEFHPDADAEFAAQLDYYERAEAGLGVRFYHEVMASLEWIAQNPHVPRQRKNHRRVNLKVFPVYIAYAIEGERVWILAVGHGSKRPGYWRGRLESSV